MLLIFIKMGYVHTCYRQFFSHLTYVNLFFHEFKYIIHIYIYIYIYIYVCIKIYKKYIIYIYIYIYIYKIYIKNILYIYIYIYKNGQINGQKQIFLIYVNIDISINKVIWKQKLVYNINQHGMLLYSGNNCKQMMLEAFCNQVRNALGLTLTIRWIRS